MSRTLAREAAFKALFQLDFNAGEVDERETYEELAVENAIEDAKENGKGKLNRENLIYINETVRSVMARRHDIDIVEACGQDANVAQPRQLLHHRSCDDYLINKNGIGILRAFDNLLGCRTVVDDAIAQLPESVP